MKTRFCGEQICSRFAKLTLAALLIVLSGTGRAQSEQPFLPRFQGGIDFMLGFPQDEFSDNVDNVGLGLGGQFLVRLQNSPWLIGGELGFMVYGQETREEPLSLTIPDVRVEVETTNNILLAHLLVRLQPASGTLLPYVDGLVGLHYLFTNTSIRDRNDIFEDEIASDTNFDDTAFSYGGGGGLLIQVYDGTAKKKPSGRGAKVYLDFRMRYLVGGEAEYLKKGSIERRDGRLIFDVQQSRTDIVTAQLGIAVAF